MTSIGLTLEDLKKNRNENKTANFTEPTYLECNIIVDKFIDNVAEIEVIEFDDLFERLKQTRSWGSSKKSINLDDFEVTLLDFLNDEYKEKYLTLKSELENYQLNSKGEIMNEIGNIMSIAITNYRKAEFGNSPVCQRHLEIYILPSLRWYCKAYKNGYKEAITNIYNCVRIPHRDFGVNEDTSRAILFKGAYECIFDCVYQVYDFYSNEHQKMFNLPEPILQQDYSKALKWKDTLERIEPKEITRNVLDYYLYDKSDKSEKYFEKAIKIDNPNFYSYIIKRYGKDSEIGSVFCVKSFNKGDGMIQSH